MGDDGVRWNTIFDHAVLKSYFEGRQELRQLSAPKGARICRFLFSDENGNPKRSYIGESGDFQARLRKYRSYKKLNYTERHLRANIEACEAPNRVQLQVLDFADLEFVGVRVLGEHVGQQYIRRLLEAWAELRDYRAHLRVINVNHCEELEDLLGDPVKHTSRAEHYKEIDKRGAEA